MLEIVYLANKKLKKVAREYSDTSNLMHHLVTIRPLENADGDGIDPIAEVRGNVEFCRKPTALAVSHLLPVDPHVESRIHALKPQKNLSIIPVC